ncbi:MAG: LysR family transcriptional regulator [Rubrivivax sp.]|nr:LysR family transcriptional regulator [Rubrivivax sp.]
MPSPINLNRFDLVSLRLFVAAVNAGSLTAGAGRFGISLAAASKRIAELESHVGSVLLARSKRGVVPTAAGQTLLRHAIELVAGVEQLALAMDDLQSGAGGHLRLWANTSAFGGFLPGLLANFSAAHPAVRLDLEDALSADAVRAVACGAAELAVIGENTAAEGLQTLVCDRDELMLLLPAGHALAAGDRVAFEDVLAHDLVALGRATALTRQLAAAADLVGRPLKIRVQVRSFDAMCRMVAAGLGVAILPRAGAAPHAGALGLRIKPLTGMRTERTLLLAMRDRAQLSPAALALVQMAEQRLAAGAPATRRAQSGPRKTRRSPWAVKGC